MKRGERSTPGFSSHFISFYIRQRLWQRPSFCVPSHSSCLWPSPSRTGTLLSSFGKSVRAKPSHNCFPYYLSHVNLNPRLPISPKRLHAPYLPLIPLSFHLFHLKHHECVSTVCYDHCCWQLFIHRPQSSPWCVIYKYGTYTPYLTLHTLSIPNPFLCHSRGQARAHPHFVSYSR